MKSVLLCPACGSGKIGRRHSLIPRVGEALCMSCSWEGNEKDLVSVGVGSILRGREGLNDDAALQIVEQVTKDYLLRLGKDASKAIGLAMVQSGLLPVNDSKLLARVIKAACIGIYRATLDEMEKIQKEYHYGPDAPTA